MVNKVNKKIILLILMLLLVSVVKAQESKVVVLNFHYKDGFITFKEKTTKLGYHPDRNFQPEGYGAEVVSATGEKLYSFRFKLPLDVFIDYADGLELKGGVIKLNETDFSLIVPYFEEAQEINFYNERDYKVATLDISRERFAPRKGLFFVFIVAGLIIVGLIYIIIKKRNSF